MAVYFFAMYLLGASIGPAATGWLSDSLARKAAVAGGSATINEAHRAAGLHQAMYIVPILGVFLVCVLFMASRELKQDPSVSRS
jgi:MFS family permease